jgi:heptosyltransferase-2
MRLEPNQINRIIVRGANWIGDAVMTLPALERLRSSFPRSHIALLATPLTTGLFESSPFVDEVIEYRRREDGALAFIDAVRLMRARRLDLAALFQNAFEAALLAQLGGARRRIGFVAQGRGPLLTHKLRRGPRHGGRHQVHDYLDIVAECERAGLGGNLESRISSLKSQVSNPLPSLTASPAQRRAAEALLRRAGGAGDGVERIIRQMKRRGAINLAGETGLAELIGALDACDLLVSNDTGPAHIAAALGRPTLTIFGPTDEFETAPRGARAEAIRAEGVECARCMLRDCPIDHRCMTRVAPSEVFERALKLL